MDEFKAESFWGLMSIKCSMVYGVGLFIIFPLCLVKDVSKLRIASLLGIITLVGIIILLIFELPSYIIHYWANVYVEPKPETHLNLYNIKTGFTIELDFFQYCSSVYYSYIVTIGAVPIFRTINNNALRRVQKVIRRTVISDIFLYSTIIVIGYLTFPINTPSLIIERDKIVENADIAMSIGRIGLVLTIIMKLPSSYNSVRICLFDLIWGVTEINSFLNNFLLTLFVLIFCCSVGVLYSEISSYIKLIGGICSGIVGFIMPALIYVKVNKYHKWHWKNVVTIITCFGLTFIGFISAGKTIYDMISNKSH